MAWIESHTVLIRHRKLLEFACDLKVRPVLAMGHLHALWHSALEQQENGVLSSWSVEMVALASAYTDDAKTYVAALQKHGWMDSDRKLHDWWDYAGSYLRGKYKRDSQKWMKIKAIYDVPGTLPVQSPHTYLPTYLPTDLPQQLWDADQPQRKVPPFQQLVMHFASVKQVSVTNPATKKKFFEEHGRAASAILSMSDGNIDLAKQAVSEIAAYLDGLVAAGKISEWRNLKAIENNYIKWRSEHDKPKPAEIQSMCADCGKAPPCGKDPGADLCNACKAARMAPLPKLPIGHYVPRGKLSRDDIQARKDAAEKMLDRADFAQPGEEFK